jgi:phosphoribosyl 1,2-cyclic phosphate phosphodiesterase
VNRPTSCTRDIRGKLVVLGSGTSVGVPTLGCDCPTCRSDDPKDQRTRCSVILGLPEGNLLIDTPPDLRFQLLRERISMVHCVLYTHEHADHLLGLDDLRVFQFQLGGPVPIYCDATVETRIRRVFDYAFCSEPPTHLGAVPSLEFHRIDERPFHVLGTEVVPVRLLHGPRCSVLGFRIGKVAYCTDTNGIPEESRQKLTGLDTLILDALRPQSHATHFSLQEAIEVAQQLRPRQTYFTHISCRMGQHRIVNMHLPPGMQLAYDGLEIPLT